VAEPRACNIAARSAAKEQKQVHRLIAGPGGVYICNECIDLCREIIEEEQASMRPPAPPASGDAQDAESAQALRWTSSSGHAQRGADRASEAEDLNRSGKMETPDTSTSQRQIVDDALRAHLVPLAAELEETRASLERLARENGALRERLRSHEGETER